MVPVSRKPISISIAYEVVSRDARCFKDFFLIVALVLLFKFRFFLHSGLFVVSFLGVQHDLPDGQCVMVDVLARQRMRLYFVVEVPTRRGSNLRAYLTIQVVIRSVVMICVATEVVVLVNIPFRLLDISARYEQVVKRRCVENAKCTVLAVP